MKGSAQVPYRGLSAAECPLRHDLQLSASMLDSGDLLGVAQGQFGARMRETVSCIVANVVYAAWKGQSVFYSRDNNHYAKSRAFAPPWFTRQLVVSAVAILVDAGYVEEHRTHPSPFARYRSRLCATTKLMEVARRWSLAGFRWSRAAPVVIRGKSDHSLVPGEVLEPSQLASFHAMEREVEAHNAFLDQFSIELDAEGVELLESGLLVVGGATIDPTRRRLVRIFNGDLEHGGRWYGAWWQGIPARARSGLFINGQPTLEYDYAACQLRLMFGHLGLPDPLEGAIRHADPQFDLYGVAGVERDVVKRAIMIMANSRHAKEARASLAASLAQGEDTPLNWTEATRVMRAVTHHFPNLRQLWFSGIGLRMQRVDSDVCAAVQATMRRAGVPVLSVHDSFLTWRSAEAQLRAAMECAFEAAWPVWR
jgi:hypothetical protein